MTKPKAAGSFYKKIFITSAIVLLIVAYPAVKYFTGQQVISLIWGFGISLLNAVLGYELSVRSLAKSNKMFMVMVFGGMGIRMIVVAIFIVILVSFSNESYNSGAHSVNL